VSCGVFEFVKRVYFRYFVLTPGLCGSDRVLFFSYLEGHLESSYVHIIYEI